MENRGDSKRKEPAGSALRREMLLSTRAAGVRWREAWFIQLAAYSRRFGWSRAQINAAVRGDVTAAAAAKHLANTSTVASEGRLAAHPSVRDELERLMALRDEVWAREPDLTRRTLQRPSHALVLLMRLQRGKTQRRHVADISALLQYLQMQPKRSRSGKMVAQPSSEGPATQVKQMPLVARSRTPRIPLTYQADQATHEALRRKSFHTRIPIQRLIDSAVQSWLQSNQTEPEQRAPET